jgi:SET domain-containing protein
VKTHEPVLFPEKYLVVKTSTLPGCGRGLFTKKFIPKGTLVIEYKGKVKTWKDIRVESKKLYIYEYMYTINDNLYIDASRSYKALARYANDAMGFKRVKGITNNCVYTHDEAKAFIKATKDIPAGSEILVRYGKMYWDVKKARGKK